MNTLLELYDKALQELNFDKADRIKKDIDKLDAYASIYGKVQRGNLVSDGRGGMKTVLNSEQ